MRIPLLLINSVLIKEVCPLVREASNASKVLAAKFCVVSKVPLKIGTAVHFFEDL